MVPKTFSSGEPETDGNTKQPPLLRSSRSFFHCGFSKRLEGVSCYSGKMEKQSIVTQLLCSARGREWGKRRRRSSGSSHVREDTSAAKPCDTHLSTALDFAKAAHVYARVHVNEQTHRHILMMPNEAQADCAIYCAAKGCRAARNEL